MRIIWGYIKERIWFVLLAALCVGMFAAVLFLYGLPVEAAGLTSQLPAGQRGWVMNALADGRIYLHAASPLRLEDGVLVSVDCARGVVQTLPQ